MTMKQPELGKKIVSLRQQKSMTQEDLVEACNVSVRTIQRIESGEVMPRVSTVKIIIAALGEDIESLITPQSTPQKSNLSTTENWLQIAWVSGIAAFILGFIDSAIEIDRMDSMDLDMPLGLYLSIKMGSLTSLAFFIVGLIKLGSFFENRLLEIAGYLLIGISAIITTADIVSVFYEGTIVSWITVGTGLLMGLGSVQIVFGLGLLRLQDAMGVSSKAAGILEIVAGICLVTIILVFIGFILTIPAMILEITLLYKGYELVRSERMKS